MQFLHNHGLWCIRAKYQYSTTRCQCNTALAFLCQLINDNKNHSQLSMMFQLYWYGVAYGEQRNIWQMNVEKCTLIKKQDQCHAFMIPCPKIQILGILHNISWIFTNCNEHKYTHRYCMLFYSKVMHFACLSWNRGSLSLNFCFA